MNVVQRFIQAVIQLFYPHVDIVSYIHRTKILNVYIYINVSF